MRSNFRFKKIKPVKITMLLAFYLLVSGCHTGNEAATITRPAAKKEEAVRVAEDMSRSPMEVKRKPIAESDMKRKQNEPDSFPKRERTDNYSMAERDPFALPAEMQKQKCIPAVKKTTPVQAAPSYTPEPCVAGIFDNGKEKFALVRWQKVQGVFRCGEHLGNGYLVKEITASSVLLCKEQNRHGADTVTLTLQ